MDISKFDKNFAVTDGLRTENIKVYSVLEKPFSVHGLQLPAFEGDCFRRMPSDVAKTVSHGVYGLHEHTAGGRVRFATNANYIAIYAKLKEVGKMPHFALTGSCGFDLYAGKQYVKSYIPQFDITDTIRYEYFPKDTAMQEYTLNFPLYSSVYELYIIVNEDATVQAAKPYTYQQPVVFYGSSITQGGCASRPGTVYMANLSRKYDFEYINLGFSGNAKGEDEMAEYIASLDMSAFVYDYDHNADSAEHLQATHEKLFQKVRQKHPNIPIICMSRPVPPVDENVSDRAEIIRQTVENAKKQGDKNVYFVHTREYVTDVLGDGVSVDGCHPNDLGFYGMTNALEPVMNVLFKK